MERSKHTARRLQIINKEVWEELTQQRGGAMSQERAAAPTASKVRCSAGE